MSFFFEPRRAIKLPDSSLYLYRQATLRIGCSAPPRAEQQPVKPDDHSEVVPLLPIPNRTVKRLSADDSAGSRVKVGHRQATIGKRPTSLDVGRFAWY